MAKKSSRKPSRRARAKAPARRSAAKRGSAARRDGASRKPSPIPRGMHTCTPQLVFKDAARAIDFYKQAFGAKELTRMPTPDGRGVWHAEIRIGDSTLFLGDESPQSPCVAPSPTHKPTASIMLYVPDCDAVFQAAVQAGARATMPLSDMFWGDRYGQVTDPFGQVWGIATHVKDVSPEEMRKAGEEWAAKNMPQAGQQPQTQHTHPN